MGIRKDIVIDVHMVEFQGECSHSKDDILKFQRDII